ncbi:MAG TPA: hypothetical protein VHX44_02070, partial [Planctomycetota bacterium]|nr:hypothetical protein [Planctomycetota bacterium]
HTDELDCVALLQVDSRQAAILISRHRLKPGSQLMAVNMYIQKGSPLDQHDVIQGPKARGIYGAFHPIIADFLTDDTDQLMRMKTRISEEEWGAVERKARLLVERKGWVLRSAHPLLSLLAAPSAQNPTGERTPKNQVASPARRGQADVSESDRNGLPGWAWFFLGLLVLGLLRLALRG